MRMASSRASTPAARKRTAKRATAAKAASRKRTGGAHKQGTRAATAKPGSKPKPKKTAPKNVKPKATKAKATKPKASRPKKAASAAPGSLVSRAITIALVVGMVTLVLAAAYWFWFRDSSFVAVEKVTVKGIDGPEAAQVTDALTRSAKGMTTLHVNESELAAAVSRYPTAVAIQAESDFPHGLTIEVTDRPPVLTASDGGPEVAVAGDGTLLHGVDASSESLPAIQVESVPAKGSLAGEPLVLAQVAGAAPSPLRPLIDGLTIDAGDGILVTLEGGIPVKFGDPDELAGKWKAVSAVLANPQVKTLTHLDVRVPERPSIGGAAPALKTG
jgi:cell division protein FtsQ